MKIILTSILIIICITTTNAQEITGKYKLISTSLKEGRVITVSNKDSMVKVLSFDVLSKIYNDNKKTLTKLDTLDVIESGNIYYNNLFEETYYFTKDGEFTKYSIGNNNKDKLLASLGYYSFNEDEQKIALSPSGAFAKEVDVRASYNKALQTISCLSDTTNNAASYIKDVYKKIANYEKLEDETNQLMDTAKMLQQKKYFPDGYTSLYIGAHNAYVNLELPKLKQRKITDTIVSVKTKNEGYDDIVYIYIFGFNKALNKKQIDDYLKFHYGKFNNREVDNTWKFEMKDGTRLIIWQQEQKLYICNAVNF